LFNRFRIGYLKNISAYGARGGVAGVNLIDNALLAATTSPNNSLTVSPIFSSLLLPRTNNILRFALKSFLAGNTNSASQALGHLALGFYWDVLYLWYINSSFLFIYFKIEF
jgi:hypothetical protein